MRITVRLKLILLVASGLLTLALVAVVSEVIEAKNRDRLADIEARLLPRFAIGPRLEAAFIDLRRQIQDAAAAQDPAALAETLDTKNRLFALIAEAGPAIEPSIAGLLRWSIQDYYEAAVTVSTSLIQGETGERQLQQMAEMQRRLRQAEEVLRQATVVDEAELAGAFSAARRSGVSAGDYRRVIGLAGVVLLLLLGYWASRQMLASLAALSSGLSRFSTGDFDEPVRVSTNDELGDVAREANAMARSLRELAAARDRDDWVKSAHVEIADTLRGNPTPTLVAEHTLRFLVQRTGAVVGALYLLDDSDTLVLTGSYAREGGTATSFAGGLSIGQRPMRPTFRVGEGLVGQAFLSSELVLLSDLPDSYVKVVSGLGESPPRTLALLPLSKGDKAVGVIELALMTDLGPGPRALLESVRTTIAITFEAADARRARENLLVETQRQAERLAAQEEELRLNNQELAAQQHELRDANDELEAQRAALSDRNRELDLARERVMEKVEELGRVSRYKSQFLANMSHELRTPLNSMLLLSHLLAENSGKNLSAKQVEYASTIHSAGEDLLSLINQVLDLSKIEAGKQELHLSRVSLAELAQSLAGIFRPLAEEKGLEFRIELSPDLPPAIESDRSRIERIVTNLLGNAIKFTEHGMVSLLMSPAPADGANQHASPGGVEAIALAVSDTGIGIAQSELERIFVPFEQIEASSARRYQGTGLGLSIARESAMLLGGRLTVDSTAGRGSTFTLHLPLAPGQTNQPRETSPASTLLEDDRADVLTGDPHVLLIEDDPLLTEQLRDIIHARQLKAVIAASGQEGLDLAKKFRPRGIVLDIKLPDIDGWTVLERLRATPETRDIPVHFLSALDAPQSGLSQGTLGYLTKPASRAELVELVARLTAGIGRHEQRILVVEDHPAEGQSLVMAFAAEGFEAALVPSAAEALRILGEQQFSCIILDLGLPDMDGLTLLRQLREREDAASTGIVIHTGRSLTKKEARELEAYAQAVVLKDKGSLPRVLEEVRLFVHHIETSVPTDNGSSSPSSEDRTLNGLRVLVVEDDMRTAYSLLALLQSRGCVVTVAENGKEALAHLTQNPVVDLVLMDIMMPEMDGYETMGRLREQPAFRNLPIIALTARAMPAERERCLAAGANDYLTKPVNGAQLLSTLSRWAQSGRASVVH
jgi:CheY-like chemotaxis protein/signal transduction histidine kinase/HAMP domain-containing protein